MTYIVCWEFSVDEHARLEFERLYGPEGAWVELFRQAPAFRGTELWHDVTDPARYITIDRWESAKAYAAFREEHRTRYAKLDVHAERLTSAERYVGEFAVLAPFRESGDG